MDANAPSTNNEKKYLVEDLKFTNKIWKKILVLPSSDNLRVKDQNIIKKFLKKNLNLIN